MADRDELSMDDMQKLYAGQCQLTDDLAAKLEAGSDKALLARIAELEADLATVNQRLSDANLRAPIQPVATQEDAGKVQAVCFTGDAIAKAWYATGQDIRGGSLHSFMDSLVASQPCNAVQDAPKPFGYVSDDQVASWPHTGGSISVWKKPFNNYTTPVYTAATVPQVVQAPSDEQIIEAADVTCSAWFAATEEYMFKRDNLNRFAQLITTASNAGEAAQGADE